MVEADVMLQGQGTNKQSLEPIMAKLPDTTSDINLEEWLALFVTTKKKGFKLDFQSTDAVEITLEKLKAVKHKVRLFKDKYFTDTRIYLIFTHEHIRD